MILAAGRGERLRPLTDHTPKPLLRIRGKPLIAYHIEALVRAGVRRLVINLGHLGGQIRACLGDGRRYAAEIQYSDEGERALETAGGIIQALPLLGDAPFMVVNADIYTDFDFKGLPKTLRDDAHLIFVDNPPHHPRGDFKLIDGKVALGAGGRLTYSGIGLYHPRLFHGLAPGKRPLAPLLRAGARRKRLAGEFYAGRWHDIGARDRLDALREALSHSERP